MASNEQILEYADYYLENDVTMKEAGEHFGVHKSTFQFNMKKLESIDPVKFKLVQDKKNNNLSVGMVKGGQNGKPSYHPYIPRKPKSISDGEIIHIAEKMIEEKLTLREAGEIFGISFTTLYDNLTEERLGKELYQKYLDNAWYNKVNTNKGR